MSQDIAALEARVADALKAIGDAVDRVTAKQAEQNELHQSISKELDKNITVLAKLIDAQEEQE